MSIVAALHRVAQVAAGGGAVSSILLAMPVATAVGGVATYPIHQDFVLNCSTFGFGDAVVRVHNEGSVSFISSGHGEYVLHEDITGTLTEVNTGESIASATHFTNVTTPRTGSANVGLIYHFGDGSDVFVAAGRLIWGSDGTPSFAAGANMPYDGSFEAICSQF